MATLDHHDTSVTVVVRLLSCLGIPVLEEIDMMEDSNNVKSDKQGKGRSLGENRSESGLHAQKTVISFDRRELDVILRLYGRMVAEGEWRDYAIDILKDRAVFSVFRRSSEMPLYSIEKNPKLSRRQGAYCVLAPGGMVLKRGHDLKQVIKVLEKKKHLRLV